MPVRSQDSSSEDERSFNNDSNKKPSSKTRIDDQSSVADTNTLKSISPSLSEQSRDTTDADRKTTIDSKTVLNNTNPQGPIKPPVLPNPAPPVVGPQVPPRNNTNQQQQGGVNVNKDSSNQTRTYPNGPQTVNQVNGQTQSFNTISSNQVHNELLGPDVFKDVMLNIDYGAIDAYNIGIQEPYTVPNTQVSGGQSHGAQFDVAKAIFNTVDTNRDGTISQDEFHQWVQGSTQSYTSQSYANYQTTAVTSQPKVVDYQARNSYGNNFSYAQLFDGATPEIENLLRQSGLGN